MDEELSGLMGTLFSSFMITSVVGAKISSPMSVIKLGALESKSEPLTKEKDESQKTKMNTESKKPLPKFLKSLISTSCKI